MQANLNLMLGSLAFGMLATAYTFTFLPMFGIIAACILAPIWQYRIDSKIRTAKTTNFWAYRAYSSGAVYVATSRSVGWMKVGFTTKSAEERSQTLNSSGEGGRNDWVIEIFRHHSKAGRLENAVQRHLRHLRVPSIQVPERKYKMKGRGSKEIFELDIDAAVAALRIQSIIVLLRYVILAPIIAIIVPLVIWIIIITLGF